MALVAIGAVIDVIAYALMLLIRFRFGVAVRAGEDAVVVRIGVAVIARLGIAVVAREPVVVEMGILPAAGVVAGLAGCGEPSRLVIRVVGVVVVLFVTRIAIGRQILVVIVHMAIAALHLEMRARERKRRVVVIKIGVPVRSRMTQVASGREACGFMIWVLGAVKIVQVTRHAVRVVQLVVAVYVALRALQGLVGPGQRPTGGGMVELGICP